MTPAQQAAAVYRREECARTFQEDLEAHMLNGYVFNTPTFFMMGRPVARLADPKLIVNPWHKFEREACDCWLVYLYAGDLREWLRYVPYRLPWVGFERGNVLRFHRFARIRSLVKSG